MNADSQTTLLTAALSSQDPSRPEARRDRARRHGAIKLTELIQDHRRGQLVPMPWPETCVVEAALTDAPGIVVEGGGERMWKSERLLRRLFVHFELEQVGVRVAVHNPIAPGKGAATSTINMRLSAEVVADLYGLPLDARWLTRELGTIEATDAVIPDGRTCVWDFKRARQASPLYRLPAGVYVGVVPRTATLITESLDRDGRPRYDKGERRALSAAFTSVGAVLRRRDLESLAQLATISADINARYIPNRCVPILARLHNQRAILGYSLAHSGTAAVAIAAVGTLEASLAQVHRAFAGREVDIRAFEYSLDDDTLPFLVGAGASLRHA